MPSTSEVEAAYREFLGRSMNPEEYVFWAGNPNYRAEIANSPEAALYRARTQQPPPPEVANTLPPPPPGYEHARWYDPNVKTDKYVFGRAFARTFPQGLAEAAALIGATVFSKDAILLRNGTSIIDVIFDVGGPQQRQQWTHVGERSNVGTASKPAAAGLSGVPAAAAPPPPPFTPPPPLPPFTPFQDPHSTLRERIVNEFSDAPPPSAPGTGSSQRQRANRDSRTRSEIASSRMGIGAGQGFPPGSTSQSLRKNRRSKNPLRLIGRGLSSAARGVGRAVKSKAGLTIAAIAGSAFLPGPIGPLVRSGLGKAAKGALTVGKALGKGSKVAGKHLRSGIVAAAKGGKKFYGSEEGIALRQRIAARLGAGEEVEQEVDETVYDFLSMFEAGEVPDPPFYVSLDGQTVLVVVAVELDADGLPVFAFEDGSVVTTWDVLDFYGLLPGENGEVA